MSYHEPVMVAEVVDHLIADPTGLFLDSTAGGGGHSEAILRHLHGSGHLVAVDRDIEAISEVESRLRRDNQERITILQGRFIQLGSLLSEIIEKRSCGLSGALFDLGVSSHQIDDPSRGFSYHQDGPLDMRMDRSAGVPVVELLAHVSEADLVSIIKRYGEERHARRIARAICRRRSQGEMETTADLKAAVAATGPQKPTKTLARVFQALRIEVNEELKELDGGLEAVIDLLAPGGRVATISYHSLEDRLVKQKFATLVQGCICPPRIPVCGCGRSPSFRRLHRKALRSSPQEVATNSRARSAVLRVFEKV